MRTPTKGPYRLDQDRYAIVSESVFNDYGIEDEDPEPVSVVSIYGAMGGEDTTSDALLLAASWELLEALEEARPVIAMISRQDGALLKKIDAALVKARG